MPKLSSTLYLLSTCFLCAAIYFFSIASSNPSRANVWQSEYSRHTLASTSQACWHVLTSHKTNTFLAVDEKKMRATDESEKDLKAWLIYMSSNTICKRRRWKTCMKPNQWDHTYSVHHSHTCIYAHAKSSLANALWTSIKFRPSCMSAFDKQREVQGRRLEEREMEGERRRKDGRRGGVKTSLGGQIREDCLKAWLKFLCFITLLFKWVVDQKKVKERGTRQEYWNAVCQGWFWTDCLTMETLLEENATKLVQKSPRIMRGEVSGTKGAAENLHIKFWTHGETCD